MRPREDRCDHCGLEPLPCPFCGKPGKVYGTNLVGCSGWQCGGEVDFGHWEGVENGVPAEHHVIAQWNKRAPIK